MVVLLSGIKDGSEQPRWGVILVTQYFPEFYDSESAATEILKLFEAGGQQGLEIRLFFFFSHYGDGDVFESGTL